MDAFISDQIISKINMVLDIIKRIRDAIKELIIPQPENVENNLKTSDG